MHAYVTSEEKRGILIRSIARVAKPLLFSLLIILASFLPVFFLEEREARLFDPLAFSKTFTMVETIVLLQPKSKWRGGMTKEKLVAEMDKALQTVGYVNTWVQPIRARVMMQSTGIQTPVGIKVKGPDISTIEEISQQIEGLLRGL